MVFTTRDTFVFSSGFGGYANAASVWTRTFAEPRSESDAAHGAYRVRFRVLYCQRRNERSTVQTNPPCDVRCTRWLGKTVEVITPDPPPWQVGEEVRLTIEPY